MSRDSSWSLVPPARRGAAAFGTSPDTGRRPTLEAARGRGKRRAPPYIREPLRRPEDYQSVDASAEGALAAPTAGLHFSPELVDGIRAAGVRIIPLTLPIGLGTFRPVVT